MFCAVLLKSRRLFVVKTEWVEDTTTLRKLSKVFFAPDQNTVADFSLELKYLLNRNASGVYEGYVLKQFECFHEAERYIEQKRTVYPIDYSNQDNKENVQPNTHNMEPLENITLSDDDESQSEDEANQENLSNTMENLQLNDGPVSAFISQNSISIFHSY